MRGVHDSVWGVLQDGAKNVRDAWLLAKLGAIAGFTYLMVKAPVQAARFTWWTVSFYVIRTTATIASWMGELYQQLRLAHGHGRTRPPPGPLSPFILLGVPLIGAIQNASEYLGTDDPGCEDRFMPGQSCVV